MTTSNPESIVAQVIQKAAEDAHHEGLQAARAYAQWHIGDPDWADSIVDAYLHPKQALEQLDADRAEEL